MSPGARVPEEDSCLRPRFTHKEELIRMYNYCCPKDCAPLSCTSNELSCPSCGRRFPINNYNIPLLDVVQRSEAEAFDERHEHYGVMSDASIELSKTIAGFFLARSGLEFAKESTVLDV